MDCQRHVELANRIDEEFHELFASLGRIPGQGHARKDLTPRPVLIFPLYSFLIVYQPEVRRRFGSGRTTSKEKRSANPSRSAREVDRIMFIQSLHLKDFLSFQDVDIELGPVNVLIRPNGSGKSNVINVIDFLRHCPDDLSSFVLNDGGAEQWIRSYLLRVPARFGAGAGVRVIENHRPVRRVAEMPLIPSFWCPPRSPVDAHPTSP